MFLTLDKFLAHFPTINISKEDFVKKFVVTYAGAPTLEDLFKLKSVIKTTDDPRYINREQIIDYFYDVVIVNRHTYLKEFYKSYFECPNPYDLKWDGVNILTRVNVNFDDSTWLGTWSDYIEDPEAKSSSMLVAFKALIEQPLPGISLQKNDLSRKCIRNLNYLDILHNTQVTNTCKSKTSFWQSLINVYNLLKLEDRFFAPSSIGLFLRKKSGNGINYNNFYYLFQQYQPKASILNPYTINWILKNLFSGTKILTPVLSWESYLLAFMHSDWTDYVGIDVMKGVCDRTQFLFDHYKKDLLPKLTNQTEISQVKSKQLSLYCQPSESLLYDSNFLSKYSDYFDAVLMCPPYFNMEIYPEGDQSIELYPDYQEWLTNYWENTVALVQIVLKPGKRFGFIVNNYVSLKKDDYPLIDDLNMIALKYFKLVGAYNLLNRVSPLRMNLKKRTEMLFLYEK
jgi:hypothetical protein